MNRFGDGDRASGAYDPGDPAGNPAAYGNSLDDLGAIADARVAQMTNVDTFTALQSKFGGLSPTNKVALVGGSLVLGLVLLWPPSGGSRRR